MRTWKQNDIRSDWFDLLESRIDYEYYGQYHEASSCDVFS